MLKIGPDWADFVRKIEAEPYGEHGPDLQVVEDDASALDYLERVGAEEEREFAQAQGGMYSKEGSVNDSH